MPKSENQKILLIATVDYHFEAFHLPIMQWFKEQGFVVHVAANGDLDIPFCDQRFQVPFERLPFGVENRRAYQELKEIIDAGGYALIHCHTPVGGLLGRLAGRAARKRGTKVFYTAHGFHFWRGAPLLNWFLYYPVERFLSRFTDCLITITEEDYALAKRHRFPAVRIEHVPGVGVDIERFAPLPGEDQKARRLRLGYKEDELLLVYAAEFNKNKNQAMLIRALAETKEPRFRLLLAGKGPLLESCRQLGERLGVADQVDFLGYRNDLADLLPLCDIAIASSRREGLPLNVMEAMACGLPVVASANRGHRELIVEGETGYVVSDDDAKGISKILCALSSDQDLRDTMGRMGRLRVKERYTSVIAEEFTRKMYHLKLECKHG